MRRPAPLEREERAARCRVCRHRAARAEESEGNHLRCWSKESVLVALPVAAATPSEQGSHLRCRN